MQHTHKTIWKLLYNLEASGSPIDEQSFSISVKTQTLLICMETNGSSPCIIQTKIIAFRTRKMVSKIELADKQEDRYINKYLYQFVKKKTESKPNISYCLGSLDC